MATQKEYLEFVLEQLSGIEGIDHRAMMGEYVLYYRQKVIGGIYDNRVLVKPIPAAKALMPEALEEIPYPGPRPCCCWSAWRSQRFYRPFRGHVCGASPAEVQEEKKP